MLADLVRERCDWAESPVLLDFGCGTHGNVAASLCEYASQTVAVDIDDNAVKLFNRKCELQGLKANEVCAIRSDLFHAAKKWHGYFDICTAVLVFHHLDSPLETSKTLLSHLKPGGQLIVIDLLKQEGIRGFELSDITQIIENAGFTSVDVKHGPKIRLHKGQIKTRLLILQAVRPSLVN